MHLLKQKLVKYQFFRLIIRESLVQAHWAIGIFKQELLSLIPVIEGNTEFPQIYFCNKNIRK